MHVVRDKFTHTKQQVQLPGKKLEALRCCLEEMFGVPGGVVPGMGGEGERVRALDQPAHWMDRFSDAWCSCV